MSSAVIHLSFMRGTFNLYLVKTPKGPVLVDAGIPGMWPWIGLQLKMRRLKPSDLAGVLFTHCHLDHTGCADKLDRLGIPLFSHPAEVPILRGEKPYPGYGGIGGLALKQMEKNLLPPRPHLRHVKPLDHEERLFGGDWQVIEAPGHSPGSIGLWNTHTGDLITGDTLNAKAGKPTGPHPLYTENLPQAKASALRLLDLNPRHLYPGHGHALHAQRYQRLRVELRTEMGLCPNGHTHAHQAKP